MDGLDELLDLRGLKCPQPVLRTRRRLRRLPAGATIRVECTDPLAALDIPNLVREMADELLSVERVGAVVVIRIRRAGHPARGKLSGAD